MIQRFRGFPLRGLKFRGYRDVGVSDLGLQRSPHILVSVSAFLRPAQKMWFMSCSIRKDLGWVLPPLSSSWIIIIIWFYIALNRTPNIDCYWVGGSTQGLGLR